MTAPVLNITSNAAERIKSLLSQSQEPAEAIRVGVRPGGCSGMSYFIEYASEAGPADEVIEAHGVKVFIDPKAVMYIIGSEMDYAEDDYQAGFVFRNPNEAGRCGCGKSFKTN